MAKRFDRWVANPEGMALPQCYDEFLDREELTCPISGCLWHGKWLSLHVNQAHGLPANDFKRAAGFNLGSGIISKPLAERLSERRPAGVAITKDAIPPPNKGAIVAYRSKESSEHARKARADARSGPQRSCKGCGDSFRQSTQFGRALYCSVTCREAAYAKRKAATEKKRRLHNANGTFRWV